MQPEALYNGHSNWVKKRGDFVRLKTHVEALQMQVGAPARRK